MFFSEDLLTKKKGTFGIIWLAATLGPRTKRITRKDLIQIDLSRTCELIAEPPEPMALRLSGCLLVGVARVYNQNYEIFYTDVTQFHTALRRSIVTDFASVSGVNAGGSAGVDMIGDGKSRYEQITFTELDISRQTGFDFDFDFINWKDPFASRKRRRGSSKLESLPSQQSKQEGEEEEEESEDDDSDDDEMPQGREKRKRVTSSPMVASMKDTTRKRTSIYHQNDHIDLFSQDPDFQMEQNIDLDLGLFDAPGDISISAPSGRGIELPDDPTEGMDGQDFFPDMGDASIAPEGGLATEDEASPAKKRKRQGMGDDSLSEIEDDLEVDPQKKRKPRQKKKVAFDRSLEVADDQISSQAYDQSMQVQRAAMLQRDQTRAILADVDAMVDAGGLWIEYFDTDMQVVFATLTRVDKFKWEQDVLAHKAGDRVKTPPSAQIQDIEPNYLDEQHGDVFGANDYQPDYNNAIDEFAALGEVAQQMPRQGSEDVEVLRRASQQSQQSGLPWQDVAFGRPSSDAGLPNVGADSSFTPGSLRYSLMTPQEMQIRLRSRHGSSSGLAGSLGRNRRARSASGSVLGRGESQARMLIGDDDLELPPDDLELDGLGLPDAYQPEMLASIESQCRDFLSFVEQSMQSKGQEELDFEDLAPPTSSKRVAAAAFYNCLTLSTKRLLDLDQPQLWGVINIRLSS